MRQAIMIHEKTESDGSLSSVFLVTVTGDENGSGLGIVVGEEPTRLLPAGALEAVMTRYGTLLNDLEKLMEISELDLGAGDRLRYVRHLGFYDVIARDYLVYEAAGREAVFAMAVTVAAALEHLARAQAGGGPPE